MKLQLEPLELKEIQKILKNIVPHCRVWAFGSRVRGTAKRYSDLDLAIISPEPLSFTVRADLQAAFDEADLIFRVDVVDWATTSDTFRSIIEAEKIVLQDDVIS